MYRMTHLTHDICAHSIITTEHISLLLSCLVLSCLVLYFSQLYTKLTIRITIATNIMMKPPQYFIYTNKSAERVCADCRVIEANGCVFDTTYVHTGPNPLHCDPHYSGEQTAYLVSPKMAFLGYLCTSGMSSVILYSCFCRHLLSVWHTALATV